MVRVVCVGIPAGVPSQVDQFYFKAIASYSTSRTADSQPASIERVVMTLLLGVMQFRDLSILVAHRISVNKRWD